jgi:hypothetical protein
MRTQHDQISRPFSGFVYNYRAGVAFAHCRFNLESRVNSVARFIIGAFRSIIDNQDFHFGTSSTDFFL